MSKCKLCRYYTTLVGTHKCKYCEDIKDIQKLSTINIKKDIKELNYEKRI